MFYITKKSPDVGIEPILASICEVDVKSMDLSTLLIYETNPTVVGPCNPHHLPDHVFN